MVIQKGTTTIVIPSSIERMVRRHELMHMVYAAHYGWKAVVFFENPAKYLIECPSIMNRAVVVGKNARTYLQSRDKWYAFIDAVEAR